MGLGIPPLKTKITLESSPPKSRSSVRRLDVHTLARKHVARRTPQQHGAVTPNSGFGAVGQNGVRDRNNPHANQLVHTWLMIVRDWRSHDVRD